jgi:hypothetical protein
MSASISMLIAPPRRTTPGLSPPAAGGPAAMSPVDQRVTQLEAEVATLRGELAVLHQLLEKLSAQLAGQPSEPTAGDQPHARLADASAAALEQRLEALEAADAELGAATATLDETLRDQSDSLAGLARAEQRRAQLSTYGTFKVADPSNDKRVYDAEAFEIVLSGQPHERIGSFAEIEFERAAAAGGPRGGEVLVEQAYASFGLTKRLNLRAGVLLVPFGNVGVDHYAPNRDVISKPLVSYVIAPSDWTDNGFGLQGNLPVGAGADSLSFELYSVAGLDSNITAVGTRAARQAFGEDNNNDKAFVGRLAWTHGGVAEIGLSGYTGAVDDAGRERLEGWAVDGRWTLGRLVVTGELDRFTSADKRLEGWYARATYRLPLALLHRGRHGRWFPDAHLDFVAQYDDATISGSFGQGFESNREWRWTLGLNYHPTHQWVLKINHERSEATAKPLEFGTRRAWLGSVGFQF